MSGRIGTAAIKEKGKPMNRKKRKRWHSVALCWLCINIAENRINNIKISNY